MREEVQTAREHESGATNCPLVALEEVMDATRTNHGTEKLKAKESDQ
jgi:hypothetical protein